MFFLHEDRLQEAVQRKEVYDHNFIAAIDFSRGFWASLNT